MTILAGCDAATTEGFADVARFPVYTRVVEALQRAATQLGALLIVIDDLHWADEDSARLLTFSALHLRHVPIVFLVTFRLNELAANIWRHWFERAWASNSKGSPRARSRNSSRP